MTYYWFDLLFQVKVNSVWSEGLSSCPVTQNVNKFWKTLLSVGFLTGAIIKIMMIITVGYDIFFFYVKETLGFAPTKFLTCCLFQDGLE